jgi:hypothetical protein
MRELDDEALGWFGRRLPWGSYGMLARASISSPTLGLALARWCRHHGLLNDDVTLELVRHGELAELRLQEARPGPGARVLHRLAAAQRPRRGQLADRRAPAAAASQLPVCGPAACRCLPAAVPRHGHFDAPWASLRFEARLLDLPLARDETALQQMLQRACPSRCCPTAARSSGAARAPAAGGRHPAAAHGRHAGPRPAGVAAQPAPPAANRRPDRCRPSRTRAPGPRHHLLLRTDRPIKRMAQACGFPATSFLRAFKAWTGHSPAEYRALHRVAD